jgi:hypothetical protein
MQMEIELAAISREGNQVKIPSKRRYCQNF